jgi:hypothetical protein
MAVTFETDLKDLRPQTYTQQLPLDEMFRGLGYKQAEYDQGVQQAKAITQSAANILRGYGPDQEMAEQLKGQLNDQLKKFSTLSYDNQHSINQLNGFVSSFLNNPHVTGLAARTNKYEADQKLMKEYQDRGKDVPMFLQPSLVAANKYYSSGKYDPGQRFVGQITTAPDLEKIHKAITDKLVPDVDEHGNEYIDPKRYAKAFQAEVDSNPTLKSYYQSLFNANHSDTNWDEATDTGLNNQYIQYSNLADKYKVQSRAAGLTPAERTQFLQASKEAEQRAAMAQRQLQNPNKAEVYRAQSLQDMISQIANERGEAFGYHKMAHWMDEKAYERDTHLQGIAMETANRLKIAQMKNTAMGQSPQSTLEDFYNLTKDPAKLEPTLVTHDDGGIKKFSATEIGDLSKINDRPMIGWDKVKLSGDSKDWVQYNGKINPIDDFSGNTIVKLSGEGDQQSISVNGPNIQYGSDGKPLQFINPKTKQIAFASTGSDGKPTWEVIDYPALASKLKAHAAKFRLEKFSYPTTYDDLDRQLTGKPAAAGTSTTAPTATPKDTTISTQHKQSY